MARRSVGLLPYRFGQDGLEVFLVHPGGPYWRGKDAGAWSIPKGEPQPGESPLAAARREFAEETGLPAPEGHSIELTPVRQAGGKVVEAFACAADIDPLAVRSNRFVLEWPPRSGRMEEFPEVDRAAWFSLAEAARRINAGQKELLNQLEQACRAGRCQA